MLLAEKAAEGQKLIFEFTLVCQRRVILPEFMARSYIGYYPWLSTRGKEFDSPTSRQVLLKCQQEKVTL